MLQQVRSPQRLSFLQLLFICSIFISFGPWTVSAARRQERETTTTKTPATPKQAPVAGTECLATDLDFSDFHCLNSPPLEVQCENEHPECQSWADRGECKANPQYMLTGCRKSCGTCIPYHGLMEYGNVPQIAPDSQTRQQVLDKLRQTQAYQFKFAQHSWESFKTCRNISHMCAYWSIIGECQHNPELMQRECAAACQTCE